MQNRPSMQEMSVDLSATLRQMLSLINRNGLGVCFVTENGKILGLLTDGDIRRLLLADVSLEDYVAKHMQKNIVVLSVDSGNEIIQQTLSSKIRYIPLVDEQGKLVDYACAHRYRNIPLVDPLLDGNELAYVTDCITSKWVSSQGKYVRCFEDIFVQYTSMPEALAVSNCTVALELALRALNIGPGDEVIVPDLTFAASINAILHAGATPVLADVCKDSWTLDPDRVIEVLTKKSKAIMPVHLYGHPCHMDPLMEIAHKNSLFIIEDCAEALGSLYQGQPVGSFGDAACFSFFGNKTITTGEGGMLLLRDPAAASRARMLRDHGMSRDRRYWHDLVGFNFRMTNLQAAIGVAQMERLDEFVAHKRRLAETYYSYLSDLAELLLPVEKEWAFNSYWLFTVLIREDVKIKRDDLMKRLLYNGIETRPVFVPMHCMPIYSEYCGKKQDFVNSSMAGRFGICLPSAVTNTREHIDEVASVLKRIFAVDKLQLSNRSL